MTFTEFIELIQELKKEHTMDWIARALYAATEPEEATLLIERLSV